MRMFSWSLLALLLLPQILILRHVFAAEPWTRLMLNHRLGSALVNSLVLAAIVAVLSTILAWITAAALAKVKGTVVQRWRLLLLLPLFLPEISLGLAWMNSFITIGVPLGWATLLLSHFAFVFPLGVLVMWGGFLSLDASRIDAARDLGASGWKLIVFGYWPQLKPAVLGAFVSCFALSLDDFLVSFFVKGLDQNLLPVTLYSMMRVSLQPEVYALASLLFCVSLLVVLLSGVWTKNHFQKSSSVSSRD